MPQPIRLLIADDDASMRWVLTKHFQSLPDRPYRIDPAATGREALDRLTAQPYDLILLDIRMPPPSGLELLKRLREQPELAHNRETAVLVMTAQNTMANAVEAMRLGAFDYLTKPFDLEALTLLADRAVESTAQTREIRRLKRRLEVQAEGEAGDALEPIGRSPAMQEVFKAIGKIAQRPVNVLITGESGSGKEIVARAVHRAGNPQAPFVALNMAAIPKDLMESELFGHEKGAFTGATESKPGKFELATGGTLFLDEIGEMSPDLQAKLLRVLEEGLVYPLGSKRPVPVNPRLIAATNRRLEEDVKSGKFREDLYYRLNVFPLALPPLRDRPEDIPLLAEAFIRRYAREYNTGVKLLDGAARVLLTQHPWPGNVRELENTIKRALLISDGPRLTASDFPGLRAAGAPAAPAAADDEEDFERAVRRRLAVLLDSLDLDARRDLYEDILSRVERPLLDLLLERTRANQLQAARILGINRNTLRKKIHDLGIDVSRRRGQP